MVLPKRPHIELYKPYWRVWATFQQPGEMDWSAVYEMSLIYQHDIHFLESVPCVIKCTPNLFYKMATILNGLRDSGNN